MPKYLCEVTSPWGRAGDTFESSGGAVMDHHVRQGNLTLLDSLSADAAEADDLSEDQSESAGESPASDTGKGSGGSVKSRSKSQ